MELIKIYFIFFKIGLFTIGGGLASIPLLQEEVFQREWFTSGEFADMIAVSQSTPGPIGVNMATYVGFTELGILGAIVATLGLVSPSIIIICLIAKFLKHFNEHKIVKGCFYGIKPAVIGAILAAAFQIGVITFIYSENIDQDIRFFEMINYKAFLMFGVFMYVTNKWKYHPIIYIIAAGAIGMIVF